jgi:isoaspartyl peptidase/L-asparaginase-like protein (Ntn-hydrolase superfamily)
LNSKGTNLVFAVGSVGYMKRIKKAISVARKVMEETYQTLLVAEEATQFAKYMVSFVLDDHNKTNTSTKGFPEENLQTNRSYMLWYNWTTIDHHQPNYWKGNHTYNTTESSSSDSASLQELHSKKNPDLRYTNERPKVGPDNHDTIGMVAIDKDGNIACGTFLNKFE